MRGVMSVWTNCPERECLAPDLGQRRSRGYPARLNRFGRCASACKEGCRSWAAPRLFRAGRKGAIATTALAAVLLAGTATNAHATVWSGFANSSFVTMSAGNDTLTFTFDGKSAANTDNMDIILAANAQQFIIGNNAVAGTSVSVTGLSPGVTYNLELIDTANGEHWSSDPNKDGTTVGSVTYTSDLINNAGNSCSNAGNSCAQAPHLAATTTWSDFGLGGSAPGAAGSTYYGWADLPLASNVQDAKVKGGVVTQVTTNGSFGGDYNDLVFQISQSSAPVRESASLTLLCAGLLGIGLMRRRHRTVNVTNA